MEEGKKDVQRVTLPVLTDHTLHIKNSADALRTRMICLRDKIIMNESEKEEPVDTKNQQAESIIHLADMNLENAQNIINDMENILTEIFELLFN